MSFPFSGLFLYFAFSAISFPGVKNKPQLYLLSLNIPSLAFRFFFFFKPAIDFPQPEACVYQYLLFSVPINRKGHALREWLKIKAPAPF